MDDKTMKISKKCPKCGRRLFDKISPASGYIEIKCNKCGAMVKVNLALCQSVKRRTTVSQFWLAS